MSVKIAEFKPSATLAPYVERYWRGDFNEHGGNLISQRVVPTGYVELIIHLSDLHCDLLNPAGWSQSPNYTIFGLYTRPYEVQFSKKVRAFGIRFKPEGIYTLFGVPASKFKNGYEDLKAVLGLGFSNFCDTLRDKKDTHYLIEETERYLQTVLAKSKNGLSYVNFAGEFIRKSKGMIRIEDLPNYVHISLRQLEREFKDKLGISPKQYQRIFRVNEVHRLLETEGRVKLTEVAYESGYADQAHFIRDFQKITGATPRIFVKDRTQFLISAHLFE